MSDKSPEETKTLRDLGWANGWKETPKIVKECDHPLVGRRIGNCAYERKCYVCGYVYSVDSSG